MKILFLDIDGVLNTHEQNQLYGHCIYREFVLRLNKIIKATDCKLVITSSWRYSIINHDMEVSGFEFMLKSHGLVGKVISYTCPDELEICRSNQIAVWFKTHSNMDVTKYVVLDDSLVDHPCVYVNCHRGLTDEDVDKAIAILNS